MIVYYELVAVNQLRMFVRMTVGLILCCTIMFMVMVLAVPMQMLMGHLLVNMV